MKSKWQRFKEGVKNLSPSQQLKSKMTGQIGNIFGMTFAAVFLVLNHYWYFIFVMAFTIFIQFIDFIGTRQQYEVVKKMEKAIDERNEYSKKTIRDKENP